MTEHRAIRPDRNTVADALNSLRFAEKHLILTDAYGLRSDDYEILIEKAREEIYQAARFLGVEVKELADAGDNRTLASESSRADQQREAAA